MTLAMGMLLDHLRIIPLRLHGRLSILVHPTHRTRAHPFLIFLSKFLLA